MQCVSRIVQCIIAEQPVVGLIQQLLKVKQIRRAVSATFAASQERVDSFKVRRRCEASPRGRGVHQPGQHYISEDSLQADVVHSVLPYTPRAYRDIAADVIRRRQVTAEGDAKNFNRCSRSQHVEDTAGVSKHMLNAIIITSTISNSTQLT